MNIIEAIRERRSVNFFDPSEEIPDEKLKEIIELANLAPSSFNLQPWKLVIVRTSERKKILRRCAFDQAKVEEASAVIIMIADPDGVEENRSKVLDSWEKLGYMKPEMRDVYSGMMDNLYGPVDSIRRKIFAVKNASFFAMSLMIAARAFEYETHPMDGFDEDAVKREFGIPQDKIIPLLIAIGKLRKGVSLLPRAFRRKFDDFVRYEHY